MSNKKAFSLSFTKEQWIDISKIAGVLLAISAVVAFALSAVNEITQPRILAAKEEAVKNAMSEVIVADEYTRIENFSELISDKTVTQVYTAKQGGAEVGYCISVAPNGYGGAIEMMVGVETVDGVKVSKVHIVNLSETPGVGTKANDETFLSQFIGKTAGVSYVSNGTPGDNQISAIAGATVTSKAVTEGVKSALSAAEMIKGGTKGE